MPTTYAIPDGRVAMAATLYTGTGAALSANNAVNGVSFQPDWVWIKSRSAATDHKLTDSVRGVTKGLVSNSTAAETTDTQGLTAFSSGGFTVGTNTDYNNLSATYVAWQWKAGGTAVTNTAGSITSSVSANVTAGFSVVTYTGNGGTGTVGHGLGVAPSMMIVKARSSAQNWPVYHISLGQDKIIYLSLTNTPDTTSGFWGASGPSSTVLSVTSNNLINGTGITYVAYCFAPVAGYSAFGSYTGNGSADGPFVYLGFRPRFLMMKRTDVAADWWIQDTSRNPSNAVNKQLYANAADADSTDNWSDILSNGFKIRNTYGGNNASGGTFIYMAFAEVPFKFANSR